jgi:hypothetical protein
MVSAFQTSHCFWSGQPQHGVDLLSSQSQYGGGAIFIKDPTVNATIEDSSFLDNTAVGSHRHWIASRRSIRWDVQLMYLRSDLLTNRARRASSITPIMAAAGARS